MSQNRQEPPGPMVEMGLASPVLGLAEDFAAGFFIHPHRHDSAQLIHASRGVLTVQTDDGVWVIPPARAVWVPEGVTHSIAMAGRVELRSLYLTGEAAPIESPSCCVVQVSPLLHAGVMRIIDFSQPYPAGGPESRLVEVVLDEIRAAEVAPLHLPMPLDTRARFVADRFLRDPADRRSTADWAHEAGAGERTLERIFTREVGISFGRWQQQARLLEALRLLASGANVTAVAHQVGYDTPSAFIAMFRRAMGTTPARYFSG